jgi:Tol biopolymer transport system component
MDGMLARARSFLVAALVTVSLVSTPPPGWAQRGTRATGADSTSKKDGLPLTPGRTITFTTSKGSWMSVDVSPDGQTIVFDLLGDLYTLPITGGQATRLTSGLAYDAQPRFSPDGKRIAFVSDRSGGENLWIISRDGRDTVQLTHGNDDEYASPTWTPDGKYIIASKSGGLGTGTKLWIYNVDGGTGQPLPTNGSLPIGGPAAAGAIGTQPKALGAAVEPNGRYVWYAQRLGDWQYNAILPQYQLVVYDRETGQSTLMTARNGSAFRPAISPDGRWLAYGSRYEAATGLRLRDLATGSERWLAYPVQRDDQEARATLDVLPGYAFTPDSKAIIISYGGEIWRVPVDGSPPTKIPFTADVSLLVGPEVRFVYRVDTALRFNAHQIRDLAIAPDGRRIAFSALDRLYVLDSITGTPRRLTSMEVGEYQPAWSPDGKFITYVTWNDETGGHIYRVASDGRSAPQRLTTIAAYYHDPAWSPDGQRIVAVRAPSRELQEAVGTFNGGLGAELVWVPATGGAVTRIMRANDRGYPHFTSDTGRIYAYSPTEGLVSFRWDGTDVKRIVKIIGRPPRNLAELDESSPLDLPDPVRLAALENNLQPPPASLVRMAPKGDAVIAQVGMDLYVVNVPTIGGEAPTISVADPSAASFPVRKLTDVGGEFPAWGPDANTVFWAIGNALVKYDLVRAKQVDDSLKAAARANARDTARTGRGAAADTATRAKAAYRPVEHRVLVPVTRDVPRGTAVLRGGRVLTMKGHEVIENADIVITDNRITAVGPRGTVQVPAGAKIIDVSGTTITPGFVDTHYHTQWLIPNIHVGQVWQYLAMLAYGVTTTRDPQTGTTDVLTYQDRVENGSMIGPRIYSTGPGVFSREHIRDLDHARDVLKRYAQYYDTHTFKMYMTGNRQQREWLIMAAKELGLMPTTEGGLDFKLDLTHAMDGYPGIEHALPIAPLYDDVVSLFAKVGVTNSPTLIVSYGGPFGENYWFTNTNVHDDPKVRRFIPESDLDAKTRRRGTAAGGSPGPGGWFRPEEYVFPQHARFARDVVNAGGRIGVGSHGQFQGLGYHWEMWMMASGGMSNYDVLRAATILGAEAIGMGTDLGTVEAGKMADLVVLEKNPLDDIKNTNTIRFVMKNGRLYDGNTLDEVYPRERKMRQFLWQQDKAVHVSAGIR